MTTITNAVATDLTNAVDGHFIGEKLADLVDAQIFRVITNKVFAEEANYIKKTCERNDIKNVIDFGCWTGILASEVFATGLKLDNYHLVDAVPFYMNKAVALNEKNPITHELVTLIPPSFKGTPPTSMLIHPYDTLNSSSIYSGYFLKDAVKQANVRVPLAASMNITDYVQKNSKLLASDNCYVKVDLDGCDIEMISELIKNNVFPGAIEFEVWNTFKSGYTKASIALAAQGYKIPTPNLHIHQTFSVGISRNYWWAVGYDNLGTNYQCTYYDMDHGDSPVSL
jgi:hypothetical protein